MNNDDPFAPRNKLIEYLREVAAAEEPPPSFEVFLAQVHGRLEAGRAAFGDRSIERSSSALASEIQEELADVCGWSAILWSRIQRIRDDVRQLDVDPAEITSPEAAKRLERLAFANAVRTQDAHRRIYQRLVELTGQEWPPHNESRKP